MLLSSCIQSIGFLIPFFLPLAIVLRCSNSLAVVGWIQGELPTSKESHHSGRHRTPLLSKPSLCSLSVYLLIADRIRVLRTGMSSSPPTPKPEPHNGLSSTADPVPTPKSLLATTTPTQLIPTKETPNMTTKSTPPLTPEVPSSHLASLLSEAYAETERLRRDLIQAQKRAERAEAVSASLQALHDSFGGTAADGNPQPQGKASPISKQVLSPPSEQTPHDKNIDTVKATTSTLPSHSNSNSNSPTRPTRDHELLAHPSLPSKASKLLLDALSRAEEAEARVDEAQARANAIADQWRSLDSFLALVESKAVDARRGFDVCVIEKGGVLTLPPAVSNGEGNGTWGVPGTRGRTRRESGAGWQNLASIPLPPHPHASTGNYGNGNGQAIAHGHGHTHSNAQEHSHGNIQTQTHPYGVYYFAPLPFFCISFLFGFVGLFLFRRL